jgi:hypothetical protein
MGSRSTAKKVTLRQLITSPKIPNMANMAGYRRLFTHLEHGNSPDLVAEAVRFVLREQDKLEERLTVLESASGIASIKYKSLEQILIGAVFSQGGQI